jgi:hypothetical protein
MGMSWFAALFLALLANESASPLPPTLDSSDRASEVRYDKPEKLCRLASDAIVEASGLVASRRREGLFWVTNDSGDRPRLFAVDTKGQLVATLEVRGAVAKDWEDLAIVSGRVGAKDSGSTSASEKIGDPWIYIADTGNNSRDREELTIYRIREPIISSRQLGQTLRSEPAELFRFRYADGKFDCEGMIVHPRKMEVYLFTKEAIGVGVYRLDVTKPSTRPIALPRIAKLSVGSLATSADLSSDGSRFVLRFYFGLCEWHVAPGSDVLERLSDKPTWIGSPVEPQSESVCYSAAGDALFTVSEGRHPTIYSMRRSER